jgi:hypothetical protein
MPKYQVDVRGPDNTDVTRLTVDTDIANGSSTVGLKGVNATAFGKMHNDTPHVLSTMIRGGRRNHRTRKHGNHSKHAKKDNQSKKRK